MATTVRDGNVIEVAVVQECRERALATRAATENSDPREVHVWSRRSGLLEPGDAIGETAILEIAPTNIVELTTAPVGSHAVDAHDDEAKFGQLALPAPNPPSLGHKVTVRSRIDVLDHGIAALGVEV